MNKGKTDDKISHLYYKVFIKKFNTGNGNGILYQST